MEQKGNKHGGQILFPFDP